jgi:hypothetical protein
LQNINSALVWSAVTKLASLLFLGFLQGVSFNPVFESTSKAAAAGE